MNNGQVKYYRALCMSLRRVPSFGGFILFIKFNQTVILPIMQYVLLKCKPLSAAGTFYNCFVGQ